LKKERETFINLHHAPFSRRDSYLVFFMEDVAEESFGMAELWLGSERGAASVQNRNRLIKIAPVWNNEHIPYSVSCTPYELVLDTDHGTIRICMPESGLIRVSGTGEVGLELYSDMMRINELHENIRDMYDGSWQIFYCMICNLLLVPIQGKLEVDAPWNWRLTYSEYIRAAFLPDENGRMEFAIEEYVDREGRKRASYPTYEESVAQVKEDFQSFLNKIPPFDNPLYESVREKAAWTSWSHIVGPSRRIKRPMVMMMHTYMAHCSGWQQSTQAIALSDDMELAYQLLLSMYDFQGEDGQIADVVSDFWGQMKAGKPPFQGFAILWLMNHRDFFSAYTKEQIERLYHPICRQTQWWFEHRIMPGRVLPFYGNPDESGWDDATVYRESCQMITPDVVTYLILQTEALSKMADMLGYKDEAEKWQAHSTRFLEEMIKKMWNGDRFVSLFPDTEKPFISDSLCAYQPLLLGKRLPEHIIDKMAADLSIENDFLTEFGVASERLKSPYVDVLRGWTNGPINAPMQLQMVVGLKEAGKEELSREIANRYCTTVAKTGFFHIHNPYNGRGMDKGRDGVLHQHWSSWSSSIFLLLAGHYC
jgi:putative isomerase